MRYLATFGAAMALAMVAAPAEARRTAIDAQYDPETDTYTPINFTLGGYCDLNGDECSASDGTALNYTVRLGTGEAVSNIFIHGNGILSFGSAIDFFGYPADSALSFNEIINNYEPVALASYGLNLVSIGQNNEVDFESSGAFLQSARLSVGTGGVITAEWFTCYTPSSFSSCPSSGQQFLTLTPGVNGYTALFSGGGEDRGYVIDGNFTASPSGTAFLIPAEFTGLDFTTGVPEPTSWAMLVIGFGLAGASLRRRRAVLAAKA